MMKKKFFGLLLMICGFGIFISLAVNSAIGSWFSSQELYEEAAPADGINSIKIEALQDVHIIPENRKDIKAALHGEGADNADLNIRQVGGDLKVSMGSHWYRWMMFDNRLTLNVYVPERYDQNMDIHSVAGNLHFHGRSPGQPMKLRQLTVDLTSGDSYLENLQVNDLRYDSTTGNVNIQRVTAEEADLHSGSGDIRLDHFTGSFLTSLDIGNLTARIDSLTGRIRADVTTGDIQVDLPQNADFVLKAKASGGDIQCGFSCQKEWEDTVTATNGSGKYSVILNSVSGDILID
ncbi:DUF4097 family beta strand repeat-containing protein [Paenactinomyces guangxiensis]|uniref:DUF4097 family beta strand repeat protein n=1 Tax=Paenactinomyces guangxiensis TaxID=1490290 RepID=A0A7W2A804_9BACL|nr:DUF4097 family beta strand repeat-containing protein [Paenactinomyces guangxiensis]MBA4494150.1 DUF4097 family beta strand repeat protein [Paenactinomyces guangxiensis]MBH8591105.1 DUF4097 family beta strand repeat protein [Paenactinomyces guangxiensis]